LHNPEKLAIQRNWQYRETGNTEKLAIQRNWQYRETGNTEKLAIQRNWQYRETGNTEKLAIQSTQYEEKHNTIYVGHHYMQTNTNNVYKT
jgi:hypothetical protein